MPSYNYVVWFRDHTVQPDDEDYEWPASFLVTAADDLEAQAWGDHLATNYSRREGCDLLRSYLDPDTWTAGAVPHITVGEDAPDEVIGW